MSLKAMADDGNFWIETLLHVGDVLWSCLFITPLTIFYWGGTWKLMDLYLYPTDDNLYSSIISLAIGTVVCLTGYLVLPHLDSCRPAASLSATWGQAIRHVVVSRICIYILALGVLNYWRGIWNLLDHYIGTDPLWNGICVGVSGLVLLLLRSLGNTVSAPFFIELDVSPHVYKSTTRFNTPPEKFWTYLGDCLLSHLVINHMIVQVWRGLWNLMAMAILPEDRLLSYCVSLGAGFGGAFILFILQHPLAVGAKRLKQVHWTIMLFSQDIIHVAGILVTLLVWRGGWGLNRDYILDTPIEAALAHGLASVGLLLCQSLTSVSTLNLAVDAGGHGTEGFYYSIHYFWYFWKQRQPVVIQVQPNHDSINRGLLEESDDELIVPS